jgi:tRNA(Arg) A34 adenosine deaminase TadA
MTDSDLDLRYMLRTLELARAAGDDGEVPIGALVVRGDRILGEAKNAMETLQDASAHAEILAIRSASKTLDSWRLDDCTLYASLEPCPMCAGAVLNSRIARVVYAARDRRLGACHTHWALLDQNPIGRKIEVRDGLLAAESAALLQEFFRDLREGRRERSKVRHGLVDPTGIV